MKIESRENIDYGYDALGSVRQIYDGAGLTIFATSYDPFGIPLQSMSTESTALGFGADLSIGELILSLDGDYGTVEAVIVVEDANQPMYNLTVDEAHTFYIGDGDWLVHNKGGRCEWHGVGGFNRDILNKGFHFNYYTSNKKYEIGVIPDDTTNTVYIRWLDDNSTNFKRRELQTISEFLNFNKTKGAELAESLRRIAQTQAQNNPGQASAYTNIANQASRLNGIFSSGEQITVLGGS